MGKRKMMNWDEVAWMRKVKATGVSRLASVNLLVCVSNASQRGLGSSA